MSTPYFCTLCGRQHVRGKVYTEHLDHGVFHNDDELTAADLQTVIDKGRALVTPMIAETVGVKPDQITWDIQPAIDAAAIPEDIQVLPKVTAVVDGEVVNTPAYKDVTKEYEDRAPLPNMEMESRKTFQKTSEFPDRVIESLQQPEVGRVGCCDVCGQKGEIKHVITRNGYGDVIGTFNKCVACVKKEADARKTWCPIFCLIAVLCMTLPFLLYLR